ncbi:MAG: hypothetical protein IPJ39_22130 [Saprospiraceae bacterium]|nr:hypothetical protein [Saprospiraceae bacterium]
MAYLMYRLGVQEPHLQVVYLGISNSAANTPNPTMLKVELDLTNTNIFTDMGTQVFNTVPTSFWSGKSIEVVNLAGRYIDPVTVPSVNSKLVWNGYAWTPTKNDTTIYHTGLAINLPAGCGLHHGPSHKYIRFWTAYSNCYGH